MCGGAAVAVNGGAGARSQASGLIVALTTVTLLLLTGLFERLPEATLGAIVIVAVAELIDFPALRRVSRSCVEAGLFFANADFVRARIRKSAESANPRAVVLDAETSPSIDVTAAQMLADLANNLRSRGTRLLVARDVGQVRDVLRCVELPEILVGVYPTVDAAVEAALGSLGEIEAAGPHARPMSDSGIPHAPTAPDTDGDDTVADGRDAE
jgi:MFS superfamily sulfate permease-like transporter